MVQFFKRSDSDPGTRVDGYKLAVSGGFIKSARLYDEYYVSLQNAQSFVSKLRQSNFRPDVFTFMEDISESIAKRSFTWCPQSIAVLPVTTYEKWLRDQIRFKARNKLHKSHRSGVCVRTV